MKRSTIAAAIVAAATTGALVPAIAASAAPASPCQPTQCRVTAQQVEKHVDDVFSLIEAASHRQLGQTAAAANSGGSSGIQVAQAAMSVAKTTIDSALSSFIGTGQQLQQAVDNALGTASTQTQLSKGSAITAADAAIQQALQAANHAVDQAIEQVFRTIEQAWSATSR